MKKCIFFLLLVPVINASAQSTDPDIRQADSIQTLKMVRYLDISESTAGRIFSVRDSVMQAINAIREDNHIQTENEKQLIESARNSLNQKIRRIIGEEKYDVYLELTRARLRRNNRTDQKPLAGETKQ